MHIDRMAARWGEPPIILQSKNIMKKLLYIAALLIVGSCTRLMAQDYKPSKTQFMIRGYGHAGYNYTKVGDEVSSTFDGSTFAPIFMFKHGDRLLFETELEFVLEDGALEVGFEYANMSYVLNDYMTIRGGKFLLPFGSFVEKLHPAWINKLNNAPLGFGHGGIAPSSGVGAELRGAFPIKGIKVSYSLYTTNGPRINDGSDEPDEAGQLIFNNFEDNNVNKAVGGRFAIFPLTNSSLELAGSFYTGQVGDTGSQYEKVQANLYAFDMSYVKMISAIKGIIDIKGQYNYSSVDEAEFYEPEDDGTLSPYTFDNKSTAYFGQLSYRPTMSGSDFVKRLELVGRYSTMNTPEGSEWEQKSVQTTVGLNYWITWRALLKFTYQNTVQEGGHGVPEGTEITTKGFFIHWALGF